MEPVTSAIVEKLKGFAKSTGDFTNVLFHGRNDSNRRNPIEILKRLQREAFSDIMKIRERQDKVERVISFFNSSKGSPFQEANTRVRGEVDVSGALLMMHNIDQPNCDAVERAGIRSGVHSKFTFMTTVRQKDTLATEFVATGTTQDDVLGSPLSLAKVFYAANINDWFSIVAVPLGAHCRDIGSESSPHQKTAPTNYSCLAGPPMLNQHNGSGIGLLVKNSNIAASLAQFVSGIEGIQPGSGRFSRCFSTFGQIVCHLSTTTKLSLSGILQASKRSGQKGPLGALAIPVSFTRRQNILETSFEESPTETTGHVPRGSIALTLESELDESTKLHGWLEMKTSESRHLQWAVSVSDVPEDEFGWGLSLGGMLQSPTQWDHFQVETFLNYNFGNRFSFQPSLLYVVDGSTQFPALMLRSNWSL